MSCSLDGCLAAATHEYRRAEDDVSRWRPVCEDHAKEMHWDGHAVRAIGEESS